ncbi:MAG: flagellin lysine-N-methylase [Clostridia bacterium]|nr:flagellin lysine-N-methylase [Clostridia bacterium]
MSLFAPAYYPAFRCIAGACRHSCCIGWEICIDSRTLARYKSLPPRERKAILAHTVTQKGDTTIRLTHDERCPFLTNEGLCRLILAHGEEILCDICREHPRFYNEFSDRTEVGLGLCCEEAARLILSETEPFRLICLDGDESAEGIDPFEAHFFSARREVFSLLSDRTRPLKDRLDDLLNRFSLSRRAIYENDDHWQSVCRELERLDPAWDEALTAWKNATPMQTAFSEVACEQLIAYFLYRHLFGAIEDGRYSERIAFALLSAHIILSIASAVGGDDLDATLIDTARAYSAEVEYDEDNVQALLNLLNVAYTAHTDEE